ncbi:VOC family protein [Candidatus Symbiopectobacterium sp. NZEC151]|uniref:VOC family protein n=1 Tax=Candidatus Symbiopectobacterium sp. NZEC151 TaxID=2820470 RepID=UPI002226C6E2|nr:VOC family protein [Candidatus Symbiopectobacterium sp. NZEC151]MCW2476481.1 VOC family protein [Candidatus Symbiopectobacterium sp. NZEC151]
MLSADITILYASNVMKSADFYAGLFDITPVEKGPTFALFVFGNGFKLGLWSCYTVEPGVNQIASIPSGEIVFTVQDKSEVDALYQTWGTQHQVTVIQKPAQLDFGYSFAVLDPDGHRLRVCFLEEEA